MKEIQDLNLDVLCHLPYLPDLAPRVFLVWPLKDHFRSDEGWVVQQPKNFVPQGIYALVERWRGHVEHDGDYIEDYFCCTVSVFAIHHLISFFQFSWNDPYKFQITEVMNFFQ